MLYDVVVKHVVPVSHGSTRGMGKDAAADCGKPAIRAGSCAGFYVIEYQPSLRALLQNVEGLHGHSNATICCDALILGTI